MVEGVTNVIRIDLNQFKLHLYLKAGVELTLHFDSPSRRFYLSVIGLVVHEMKQLGSITSIPLQKHLEVLALLNKTVGMAAGSSKREHMLPRIYRKWKDALPDLENAPLFKVIGRKKRYDEQMEKVYAFSEAEKDSWANLFDYKGSHENVRLRFSIDRLDASLEDVIIVYGEHPESLNADAWDGFVSDLKEKLVEKTIPKRANGEFEESELPLLQRATQITARYSRWKWLALCALIGLVVGFAVLAGWKNNIFFHQAKRGSVEKVTIQLPDKPSIAVLPFDNLSGNPEQEYFSDGITDDLITDLSKISSLFVVARNSSFMYKGQTAKTQKIAEELGVRYILEGSVRRAGNKVRINAQLIDAITGGHLWAERYDRDYKDILELQDEVLERIVYALSIKLTQKEKEQLVRKYTESLEAYDYYLRGEKSLYKYSVEENEKARPMFQKAIDLDPNFAQAYAAYAMASYYIWAYAPVRKIENDREKAFEFASKALALDSNLPMAHLVLAEIQISHHLFDEAITSAEEAVDLEPNYADSHLMKAYILTNIGRHEEAIREINTGFRLNPNPPPYYYQRLGFVQFNLKQYSKAINSIKNAGDTIPESIRSWVLAPSYAYLGRLDEARATLKKLVKVSWNLKLRYIVHPYNCYFKLEKDRKHLFEGFRKAGLQDPPDHYRRSMDDIVQNILSGKEIKDLAVGRTWSGFNPGSRDQWRINFTEDGKLPTRGVWGTESGSYWIEEFRICWKWQESTARQDGCGFVYPNPKGSAEQKNQYEWVSRNFVYPFSIED